MRSFAKTAHSATTRNPLTNNTNPHNSRFLTALLMSFRYFPNEDFVVLGFAINKSISLLSCAAKPLFLIEYQICQKIRAFSMLFKGLSSRKNQQHEFDG